MYKFEAARGLWDCESEIEKPENQEIKDQSFSAVVVLIHKAQGCVRRQRPVSERNEVKSFVGNKSDSLDWKPRQRPVSGDCDRWLARRKQENKWRNPAVWKNDKLGPNGQTWSKRTNPVLTDKLGPNRQTRKSKNMGRLTTQGDSCSHYREKVCSVNKPWPSFFSVVQK